MKLNVTERQILNDVLSAFDDRRLIYFKKNIEICFSNISMQQQFHNPRAQGSLWKFLAVTKNRAESSIVEIEGCDLCLSH
jgi:hypothetical protein